MMHIITLLFVSSAYVFVRSIIQIIIDERRYRREKSQAD